MKSVLRWVDNELGDQLLAHLAECFGGMQVRFLLRPRTFRRFSTANTHWERKVNIAENKERKKKHSLRVSGSNYRDNGDSLLKKLRNYKAQGNFQKFIEVTFPFYFRFHFVFLELENSFLPFLKFSTKLTFFLGKNKETIPFFTQKKGKKKKRQLLFFCFSRSNSLQ